jgi:hypothetical protein
MRLIEHDSGAGTHCPKTRFLPTVYSRFARRKGPKRRRV